MAAHIENRDVQAGIEQAWHGMTRVVREVTFADAFPFEIEKRLLTDSEDGTPIEGEYYYRGTDDKKKIGKTLPDSYVAISNARFWEIVQNAVGGTGAIVESAGTIFDRCRRFVTVKLGTDVDNFKVGDRVFKNRFSLLDSIDQSTNLYGVNSSTCVVCANTFAVVMGDRSGEFRFKLRHSKNLVPKIENMEKAIDSFIGVTAQFQSALKIANEIPMTAPDARSLFAGWIAQETNGLSTRSYNVVGRMTELFGRGAGNKGETVLDAFSAVTDFYSHESSGGTDQPNFRWKQTLSSDFGAGAKRKQDFFGELFLTDKKGQEYRADNVRNLISNGRNLISALEAVNVN
ncbi:MAG: DUF932 domain-containing protein [Proteobacteria bacterium]|jgi:hypothetical protein|nr:DUF932 domain-containing protein [Pseudomonadota bacterium]